MKHSMKKIHSFLILFYCWNVAISQSNLPKPFLGLIEISSIVDVEYNTLDLQVIGSMDYLKDTTFILYIIDSINVLKSYHLKTNGDTSAFSRSTSTENTCKRGIQKDNKNIK
jgi:hypothetical protein